MSDELAAALQAALAEPDLTGGGGMAATVMTAQGTWSGTTGKADGVRDLQVDDQFAVASITKSVVAAQVMLMAEAGEIDLDKPVADYLPDDLGFDTNGATVRQLMGHRSGLPDSYDLTYPTDETQLQRAWTPSEILALLPADRTPAGSEFSYTETNYLILQLTIEHVRGRPLVEVLRDGSLAVDGIDRLVYQPEELPTDPFAMPYGVSQDELTIRGRALPSLASVTANHGSGAIASDSVSLAHWWRALCAGEIVSQASLTQMSTFQYADMIGGYGLGMYNPAVGYGPAFGHTGELPGYFSWAACLPDDHAVVVVLTNHHPEFGMFEYSHGLARPLVEALRSSNLIARGDFVEHDWGQIELEATQQGSIVSGQLKVGLDRGAGWPITVDVRCARTAQDGKVLIGGYVTHSPPAPSFEGQNALVYLKRGSPELGSVTIGNNGSQSGIRSYDPARPWDCSEYLDAWLTTLGPDVPPMRTLDGEGNIEFGPGAGPSP